MPVWSINAWVRRSVRRSLLDFQFSKGARSPVDSLVQRVCGRILVGNYQQGVEISHRLKLFFPVESPRGCYCLSNWSGPRGLYPSRGPLQYSRLRGASETTRFTLLTKVIVRCAREYVWYVHIQVWILGIINRQTTPVSKMEQIP